MVRAPDDPDGFLSMDDPHYLRCRAATAFEPDPRVRQGVALLIQTCPLDIRDDPRACVEYLNGPGAASLLQALARAGKKEAETHLEVAEDAVRDVAETNKELADIQRQRHDLPDDAVDGPTGRITRQQNREELVEDQRVAAHRELAGDTEHRKTSGAGWKGIIAAVVIAVIETALTLRVFNVSFTQLEGLTFLQWLGITVALAVFNAYVGAHLGRRCRDAREVREAAYRLNDLERSRAHYPNGGPS